MRGGQEFQPPPGWDAGFEFSGAPEARRFGDHSDFFETLFGAARRARGHAGAWRPKRARRGPSREDRDPARGRLPRRDAQLSLRSPELDASGHVVLHERELQVKIPKGIRAGQQIRLAGQGSPGLGGEPAGDLYLEVEFEPHRAIASMAATST